jgi:hypothetical protein
MVVIRERGREIDTKVFNKKYAIKRRTIKEVGVVER